MVKLNINFEEKIFTEKLQERKEKQILFLISGNVFSFWPYLLQFQELPFIAEGKTAFLVRSQVIFW